VSRWPAHVMQGFSRVSGRHSSTLPRARHRSHFPASPRPFKKLRKAVARLPRPPSAEELHAVRIKVKRARYAAELAQPIIGRRAERFIAKAKKLQDILGEHQDAVVAEEYLRKVTARTPAAQALAQPLIEQQRKRRKKALAAFGKKWPKLKRRGRKAYGD